MKKLILLVLFFGIFSIAGAFAQANTGLTVTTADGNPIKLYLNGIIMNNTASPYVQVYGLQSTNATLHIETQDGYAFDQQVSLGEGTASNYEMVPTNNGYQLNLQGYTSIPAGEYASLTVLTDPVQYQNTSTAYSYGYSSPYYYAPTPAYGIHIGIGPRYYRPAYHYAYVNHGWGGAYHSNVIIHNNNHFGGGFEHHDNDHFNGGFEHHDMGGNHSNNAPRGGGFSHGNNGGGFNRGGRR